MYFHTVPRNMIWAKHHANKKSRAARLNHMWEGYDYSKMHSNQLEQMMSPGLEVIKREFILRLRHVSAISQSLRFILSLRMYSSFITLRPDVPDFPDLD